MENLIAFGVSYKCKCNKKPCLECKDTGYIEEGFLKQEFKNEFLFKSLFNSLIQTMEDKNGK